MPKRIGTWSKTTVYQSAADSHPNLIVLEQYGGVNHLNEAELAVIVAIAEALNIQPGAQVRHSVMRKMQRAGMVDHAKDE